MIKSEVVADSVNPKGDRITSMICTYPRFIHSEVMTHRVFERNSASSRAIPIEKMIAEITETPAIPVWWGRRQRGMQAHTELKGWRRKLAEGSWRLAGSVVVKIARFMNFLGLHKQITNRILEPWMHMTVLITATEWDNFFAQRCHPAAQPEIQVLAYKMLDAYLKSTPQKLDWGEWHLPLASKEKYPDLEKHQRSVVSVANAARVSYVNFDNEKTYDEQENLYRWLTEKGHWSPLGHQAVAVSSCLKSSGCFRGGWRQLRQDLQKIENVDLREIMNNKPEWIEL